MHKIIKEINSLKNKEIIHIDKSNNVYYLGRFSSGYFESNIDFVISQAEVNSIIQFKLIVENDAKVNLQAKLVVPKNSKNVNIFLNFKCIVLSSQAVVNIVPSLEINENEVKAGHAASIGYIEKSHLDYLATKGLSNILAEELIVSSFLEIN